MSARGASGWLAGAGLAVAGGTVSPALSAVGPLRRTLMPGLAGIVDSEHVALTYDDGPDAVSTPRFLDLLESTGTRATFFLLGERVVGQRPLVKAMAAAGHELAVHGWDHRCVLTVGPRTLLDQVRRTAELVEDVSGTSVRFYRPPYGVSSAASVWAARRAGLSTVLWSAWGRDWEARATAARIVRTVGTTLRPGGTVLLHDSDWTSAPLSWVSTLDASRTLLDRWAADGRPVGPLNVHLTTRGGAAPPHEGTAPLSSVPVAGRR